MNQIIKRGIFYKIYQNGNVQIANDVEIGANCTIDRAVFKSTIIGNGVDSDFEVDTNLIATKSNDGFPNVAVFSSVTHLGSNPPLLGFITRPAFVPRNTYENIRKTGIYTINHIST